jgi:aryl-alcohol dehydrogenase-like predicted oxidoreductase
MKNSLVPQRALGTQGLTVSAIGLGCMGMSDAYGPADEAESIRTIHRALDLGVTFFDTAEQYGPFANETLLGRALKGRRAGVVLATKFGFAIEHGQVQGLNSRPENIRTAVEGSLKRLQTDVIDLLYQHRVDPQVPIEEVVGAMARLVEQGKVRYLGLSEAGVSNLRRAHATHPISAMQSEYSLWERNLEADVLPALRELGIGLVPFGPLGRGFLTGTAKRAEDYPESDFRHLDPRLQGDNFDANVRAAQAVHMMAEAKGITSAQLALAWVLHKGDDLVPIPGTKQRKYLEQNVAALQVCIQPEEMAVLEQTLAQVHGLRYSPERMASVDR